MLSQSRPIGLQHRHTAPRACWLWGDKQQSSAAPVPPPSSAPAPPGAAATLQQPPAAPRMTAVQAAADQQPAQVELIVQTEPTVAAPPVKPITRSLFDVLKFTGPGPELINGRLAMLAFLAVPRAEFDSGATVLQQAASAPWYVYAGLLLWVYASMVPLLKGARHEAFGFFTPQAEILNGRAAMLGFAILVALEYKAGVPFF